MESKLLQSLVKLMLTLVKLLLLLAKLLFFQYIMINKISKESPFSKKIIKLDSNTNSNPFRRALSLFNCFEPFS